MRWRVGATALSVLAVAACGGAPTAVLTHSPTPSQATYPTPSPDPTPTPFPSPEYTLIPPTPTPTPPPSLSSTLHCRLPMSAGVAGSGGFIVFPGGQFVADPASNVVIPGVPTPSPGPYGYGYGYGNFFGLTYDRRYSKWLPVPRNFVSPDEAHYVYPSPDSVYVVSVADGSKVELGAGTHAWNVFDVESDGVYANPQQTSAQVVAGLWLLPFSGAPRQIITTGFWQSVGGGAAYGFAAPQVPNGAVQPLLRLDLKTGKTSTWVTDLPQNSNVQGFDLEGHPIVVQQTQPMQIVVLTAANQQYPIYDGSLQNFYLSYGVFTDSHGIWMSAGNGLYLSTSARAPIEQVSPVSGPIAGPCV